MDDAIRVKTYRGQTVEEAAHGFQTDAAEAAKAGFVPTSQQWDGPILTVVYQRRGPATTPTDAPVSSSGGKDTRLLRLLMAVIIVIIIGVGVVYVQGQVSESQRALNEQIERIGD